MEDKISDLDDIGILSGEDEFLLIDKSQISDTSDGAGKVNVAVLADAIIDRLPVDGEKGSTGNAGVIGDNNNTSGEKGEVGDSGIQGPRGYRGIDGDDGDKGQFGLKGNEGQPGIHGDKGDKGPVGIKGEKGRTGYKGYMHEKSRGIRGDKGDKGRKGTKGIIGQSGSKGEMGEVNFGVKGFRGDIGESVYGNQGSPGNKGKKGEKGPQGAVGEVGSPFQYKKSPRRTLLLENGKFQHGRHLYQIENSPQDVYSIDWQTDILETGQHNKRFLVFELDSTFLSKHEYSRYFVEVDFEPVLAGNSTPVLMKTTLATSVNDQTNGTIALDWFFDAESNKNYLSFFSVAVDGNNIQYLIKKIYTHTGISNLGSQNIQNFRI